MAGHYDPAQPRDTHGEWTSGAGAVAGHFTGRSGGASRAAPRTAKLSRPPQMPKRPAAAAPRPAPADESKFDKADRLSKEAFSQGDASMGALQAHRDAARALRSAAKLTDSDSRAAALQKAASLHSKVASMKMENRDAEDQARGLQT